MHKSKNFTLNDWSGFHLLQQGTTQQTFMAFLGQLPLKLSYSVRDGCSAGLALCKQTPASRAQASAGSGIFPELGAEGSQQELG